MEALRLQDGGAAHALEFLILTAVCTDEVIAACAAEIDSSVWTIAAERMKGGKEHRVPLSAPALAIVERTEAEHGDAYPVSSARPGKPLSNMAMLALIERMGRADLTAHGFRSTLHDWAAERTDFPSEVAEMALARTVGGKVEAAYRRSDLVDKRIALMEQ